MKPQFQHSATTSFALWFDNYIVQKGESYINKSAELYYQEDSRLTSYPEYADGVIAYASEYKQWLYNNDIVGANIPQGVHIDEGDGNGYQFWYRGYKGLTFDFDNGRILLDGSYFPDNYNTLKIKADFAVKDINIYLAEDTEENLIIENKFNNNSRITPEFGAQKGVEPYEKMTPAAFISMENSVNNPFAFGGEDQTQLNFRVILFTETLYHLDGLISMCTDAFNLSICKVGYDHHPLNEYGDTKEYYYSYDKTVKDHKDSLMYIEDVKASKISDRVSRVNNPNLFLGFVDFTVSQIRMPRYCSNKITIAPAPETIPNLIVIETDNGEVVVFEESETVLLQASDAGDQVIEVEEEDLFNIGQSIIIDEGTNVEERFEITGIGTSELFVNEALEYSHTAGAKVKGLS